MPDYWPGRGINGRGWRINSKFLFITMAASQCQPFFLPTSFRQINAHCGFLPGLGLTTKIDQFWLGDAQIVLRVEYHGFFQASGVEGYLIKAVEQ